MHINGWASSEKGQFILLSVHFPTFTARAVILSTSGQGIFATENLFPVIL